MKKRAFLISSSIIFVPKFRATNQFSYLSSRNIILFSQKNRKTNNQNIYLLKISTKLLTKKYQTIDIKLPLKIRGSFNIITNLSISQSSSQRLASIKILNCYRKPFSP